MEAGDIVCFNRAPEHPGFNFARHQTMTCPVYGVIKAVKRDGCFNVRLYAGKASGRHRFISWNFLPEHEALMELIE